MKSPQQRILVVDDEAVVVGMLRMNLEAEGYRVEVAYDGPEALARIRAAAPDLVICDIMMPGMNGIELCRMIREDTSMRSLPFIFLTAKDEAPEKIGGLNAGADDYMTKPFNVDELIARVHAVLRRVDRVREDSVEKFRAATQDLNRLSSLGVLAASIAHEVRNQLTMALTSAEILLYTDEEPERDEYTNMVLKQLDRINHTIVSMLDYARQEQTSRTPQAVCDIVSEALELTHPRLIQRAVEVAVELPETLPLLLVDRQQICQVLINLIINATQAMDAGGRIVVRAEEADGRVDVRVEDNGPGIPAEDLDAIFRPFMTTKSKSDGIGLGLYISKEIMKAHHGSLSVESTVGAGACFTLRLPVAPPAGDAGGAHSSTAHAASPEQ